MWIRYTFRSCTAVLRIRIRDPVSFLLLLDPGWVKIRIRIRDEQPWSYFRDPDPVSEILFNLDPGWKNFGYGINIPDPQHYCTVAPAPSGWSYVLLLYCIAVGRHRIYKNLSNDAVRQAVLRIRDNHAGSGYFHPGSDRGQTRTRSRIRKFNWQRILFLLNKQKIVLKRVPSQQIRLAWKWYG